MIIKQKFKNKKIFISGHNGMVGSAVYRELVNNNFKNLIVVEKSKVDLENANQLNLFFKKKKPDFVINCAALVGGILYNAKNKIDFLNTNLNINKNIIEACYKNKIKTLVFLGSSCVYPNNISKKIKEEDLLSSSLELTNEAYALSKIVGLRLCDYYNQTYKTDYRCLMPCNLFGPKDNYDLNRSHVIPAIIKKIHQAKLKKKKYIEVWGNGKPKREFLYVEDLAKIILELCFCSKSIFKKNSFRSVINVGSDCELTINNLVIMISKVLNYKVKIKYIKKNLSGTRRKKLDLTRLKKIIGKFFLYKSFDYTLRKTYESFLQK
jgi:GDP-L-fucose synthase